MTGIDESEEYIDDEHVKRVCKIGRGELTCKYLTMSKSGWSCEKNNVLGRFLNMRASNMLQINRGDNCSGKASRDSRKIQ